MPTITINGNQYSIAGGNIVVNNGKITVDGQALVKGLSGSVNIKFEGGLASLTADGSVSCGDVFGNVAAGGGVDCASVGGNVDAGGSVRAASVKGSITAGGSVMLR